MTRVVNGSLPALASLTITVHFKIHTRRNCEHFKLSSSFVAHLCYHRGLLLRWTKYSLSLVLARFLFQCAIQMINSWNASWKPHFFVLFAKRKMCRLHSLQIPICFFLQFWPLIANCAVLISRDSRQQARATVSRLAASRAVRSATDAWRSRQPFPLLVSRLRSTSK